jgi:hypothetical protein
MFQVERSQGEKVTVPKHLFHVEQSAPVSQSPDLTFPQTGWHGTPYSMA